MTQSDGRVFDFECDPTKGGGEKEAMMWLQWLRWFLHDPFVFAMHALLKVYPSSYLQHTSLLP